MEKKFWYQGFRFQQRPSGPKAVLFLARAEELREWGSVPQKTSKFMTGFQRAQIRGRVTEISKFFEDSANTSPTAVVVAFKPDVIRVVDLPFPINLKEVAQSELLGEPVLIEVTYEDLRDASVEALAAKVHELLSAQLDGVPQEEIEVDADLLDDEDAEDQELSIHESHLTEFLSFLSSPTELRAYKMEDEPKLHEMLANLLKPGTIVDGQHRVHGTAFMEQGIPFPVVALVDAEWREQVFQFVVINQKAQPIRPEFLSAIISSSLSTSDIDRLKQRLEQADVPLDETHIMDLLESSPLSPFRSMIDFKVPGAPGARLRFSGMLNLARRFRGLRTFKKDTKFRLIFRSVFEANCDGVTYSERKRIWEAEVWFRFFAEFWKAASYLLAEKDSYQELWEPGSNLMKIVTLQELQNIFLQWLFERQEMISGVEDFRDKITLFLKHLRPKFFEKEWLLKSLQSDTGRAYLRKALERARTNPNYKYDDELFKGVGSPK